MERAHCGIWQMQYMPFVGKKYAWCIFRVRDTRRPDSPQNREIHGYTEHRGRAQMTLHALNGGKRTYYANARTNAALLQPTLGLRLATLRCMRELTRQTVSVCSGVAPVQTLIAWEHDRGRPNKRQILTLANYYGVDATELAEGRKREND